MRLPASAYTEQSWRIHEIAGDFRVEDVWALPTPGGPEDFPLLVEGIAASDPSQSPSALARGLWTTRRKLGELLHWDDEEAGRGGRAPTLRERLPADLRDAPPAPSFAAAPFTPLYLTEHEFAAEIVNATVHSVLHLAWVPDGHARRGPASRGR